MIDPPRPIRPRNDSPDEDGEDGRGSDPRDGRADDPRESPPTGKSEGSEPKGSGSRDPSPLPSVREVMGEVDDETSDPEPLATRSLQVDGARWEVTCIGATRSGEPGDAGAPLLLLRFEGVEGDADGPRGEDPAPVREGWAVGRKLSDVPEFDLVELLGRARPVEDA